MLNITGASLLNVGKFSIGYKTFEFNDKYSKDSDASLDNKRSENFINDERAMNNDGEQDQNEGDEKNIENNNENK